MVGATVYEVVESRHPDYSPGDFVLSYSGWRSAHAQRRHRAASARPLRRIPVHDRRRSSALGQTASNRMGEARLERWDVPYWRMARVLFTSCPAYGHALPLLPVIRAAERAGHDVRLATGPDLAGPLAARGIDVHAAGPTWETAWLAHAAEWAATDVPEELKICAGRWRCSALRSRPSRRPDGHGSRWRPDVTVHEVLEPAGSLLAARLGIPGVVHGIGRCSRSTPR
jgi:hypothetical protein